MFRYSPHQIEEYRLGGMTTCEVRSIEDLALRERASVWNLFWLSVPHIDLVPGTGRRWFKRYTPIPGAAGAVVSDALTGICSDALDDPVMFHKVVMHPRRFIEWFEREDHSIYVSYRVLGGHRWVETVLERAHSSSARLAAEFRSEASSRRVFGSLPE